MKRFSRREESLTLEGIEETYKSWTGQIPVEYGLNAWLYLSVTFEQEIDFTKTHMSSADSLHIRDEDFSEYFLLLEEAAYSLERANKSLSLAMKIKPKAGKLCYTHSTYENLHWDIEMLKDRLFLMWDFPTNWGDIQSASINLVNLTRRFQEAKNSSSQERRDTIVNCILDHIEALKQYGFSRKDLDLL